MVILTGVTAALFIWPLNVDDFWLTTTRSQKKKGKKKNTLLICEKEEYSLMIGNWNYFGMFLTGRYFSPESWRCYSQSMDGKDEVDSLD